MAEIASSGYQRLFEVRVLHHYFLDEGIQDFTALTVAEQQQRLMSGYDVRQFLSFEPTASTRRMLRGIHGVFRTTPLGFVIAVPAGAEVPGDARFEFISTVVGGDFMNYTALTLRRRKIVEIQHEGEVFRYKEFVPVLSNSSGVQRTVAGRQLFCLSGEVPAYAGGDTYPVEAFTLVGNTLHQAIEDTSQAPPAGWKEVDTSKDNRPVYVHQNDAPLLSLPDGSSLRGIELTNELPEDIFLLFRIDASTTNTQFGITDAANLPLTSHPVFEIHFKNRSTSWRYVHPTDQQFLPFTVYGNPAPNKVVAGGGTVQRKKATPAMLTIEANKQLFSDIIE